MRKQLAGGWGYSTEELTVLPRQFAGFGRREGRGYKMGGMGGEGEGGRERKEENIVEPLLKFLKVSLGAGRNRRR